MRDHPSTTPLHPTPGPAPAGFGRRLLGGLGFLLLFALALAATFGKAFSQGPEGMSGLYDVYQYFGPLAYFMDTVLHAGDLPLWNPLTYCGTPFAANPQAALFYPPHLVRGLLNTDPSPFTTQVSMVVAMGLHLLLAGGGAFAFGRALGLRWSASLASALAFAFSAAMVRRVVEFHFVYTLAWLPWIALLAKRSVEADTWRGTLRPALPLGVLLGFAYLGGFLQIIVYLALAVFVFALCLRLLVVPAARAASGVRLPLAWDALAVLLAGIVAALVAAAGLLPAAEFAPFTARQPDADVALYSDLQRLSPVQLLRSFVVYPGLKATGSGIRGSGVLALVLALSAVFHPRRRVVLCLGLGYLALLDCSFGPPWPLSRLLAAVLPFANSAHARAYEVALFPLSMLVGFGVDGLVARFRPEPSSHPLRYLWALLTVALGAAILIPLWGWTQPHRFVSTTPRVVALPALGIALAALAHLGRPVFGLSVLLAALVFAETAAWNVDHTDRLIHSRVLPDARMVSKAQGSLLLDNSRGVDELPNHSLFQMRAVMNGYDPLNIRRVQSLMDSWKRDPEEYHRTVTASEPTAFNQRGNLFLKRPFWLARHWSSGELPPRHMLYTSTDTVFLDASPIDLPFPPRPKREAVGRALAQPAGAVGLEVDSAFLEPFAGGGKGERVFVARLARALPGRASGPAGAVHSVLRVAYESNLPRTHVRPRFHSRDTGAITYGVVTLVRQGSGTLEIPCPDMPHCEVTLELTAPATDPVTEGAAGEVPALRFTSASVEADGADEDSLLAVLERSANHVEVEVGPLDDWRVLTFTDAAYPGWSATVDGEPAPIHLANEAFKAVAVPAGTHRVRFEFDSEPVRRGIRISIAGLALAVVGYLFLGLGARRSAAEAGRP